MHSSKNHGSSTHGKVRKYFKSRTFQRFLTGIVTIIIAFVIIQGGAAPEKYKLKIGDKSPSNITAPREIENKVKTEQNRKAAEQAVQPITKDDSNASVEVINQFYKFFTFVDKAKKDIDNELKEKGITRESEDYEEVLKKEQQDAVDRLEIELGSIKVLLSQGDIIELISKEPDTLSSFRDITERIIQRALKEGISAENLANKMNAAQNELQNADLEQVLKNIGGQLVRAILKPNRLIDYELTRSKKKDAYQSASVVKILKDEIILRKDEIVSEDKLKVLEDLNLLETKSRFDFSFAAGIFVILLLVSFLLILYMRHFNRKILYNVNEMIILCLIMMISLTIARLIIGVLPEYYEFAVPIFIAPMLVSILMDLKLAGVVNFILTLAISFIMKDRFDFFYMALISGSFSAFLVSKANQRSKLSLAGIIIGSVNVIIIISLGIIHKGEVKTIAIQGIIGFLNGIISIVFTIGILPFIESTFNMVTPLKLLELANPNQPLIKRLLMEAPGTYHHSLMVGNLAEVATEAIGGNALLSRVGAYYHDIGKLKNPGFFKENQLGDNPHESLTANLSTLVITSHINDGVDLANKYKIPQPIKDIIVQHHGTTLVAYFYHKAKMAENGDAVSQENFRYQGPRPSSKEAAVVMLADSVEAAVRAMPDKTEAKIEALIRKLIKDKLDDGQLNLCSLTLKDLDSIAKAFMRVLSGFFHGREEYPEINAVKNNEKPPELVDPLEDAIKLQQLEGDKKANVNIN
ncbi:MAG: HDIG domain-containing protein [Clostridia bacterium]|nr:HDIG domain-containing protein [Clostridia bacterium]